MSGKRTRGRPARRRREAPLAVVCEKRYSVEEAALVSSLSSKMIRNGITDGLNTAGASGIWPLERCGTRWLIPASALDMWLKSFRCGDAA